MADSACPELPGKENINPLRRLRFFYRACGKQLNLMQESGGECSRQGMKCKRRRSVTGVSMVQIRAQISP
ncbi:hypothetical protein [Rhizobium sp. AG855]|uniref:hypothetical protein n=1 Tax=Rhizobium sp. AG855 TaxID=2183898 RepID=UPI001AECC7FB|nr:hypothetical protein [Rhizobium sp. AG855]